MAKVYDSSNINLKTGKMKPVAKAAAPKPAATNAQKMAAPKPTAGRNTGLKPTPGMKPPSAAPAVKAAAASKTARNVAANIREGITAMKKREAKAGT